jgi:hypothetical protein
VPVDRPAVPEFAVGRLLFMAGMKEPCVSVFGIPAQQVQLVVAEHALRPAAIAQLAHGVDDRGAVRAAVHQIADEDEPAAFGVGVPA